MIQKNKLILFLSFLFLFLIIIRIYTSNLSSSYDSKKLSLVIFKLPRTGSTWFTETLNSYPFVYIAKEIMQHSDVGKFSPKEIEQHLIQALQTPVDKLSSRHNWFMSSQFLYNYYLTPKAYSSLSVVGLSLNIEHSNGVSWQKISKEVPNLRVVLLLRGNIIKQAVSGYRGRILHKMCGMSNIKSNSDQSTSCAQNLPKQVNWTIEDFATNLNNWQKRVYYFNQESHSAGVPTLDIQYESIQTDENNVLEKISKFLNFPTAKFLSETSLRSSLPSNSGNTSLTSLSSSTSSSSSSSTPSKYTKRTSEDLKNVLSNFDSISNYLKHPSCKCLFELLHTVEAKPVNPICYNLVNLKDNNCIEFEDKPENKPDLKFFWGTEFIF